MKTGALLNINAPPVVFVPIVRHFITVVRTHVTTTPLKISRLDRAEAHGRTKYLIRWKELGPRAADGGVDVWVLQVRNGRAACWCVSTHHSEINFLEKKKKYLCKQNILKSESLHKIIQNK